MRTVVFLIGLEFCYVLAKHWGVYETPSEGGSFAILILLGIFLSVFLAFLIYYSVVKIKISTIFNITLIYLILQSGFLLGYSVHEGLSAAKTLNYIEADNLIFTKVFDLSKTIFYHKEGLIGVPLYVSLGWYSKPEFIQFVLQYTLTLGLFFYWYRVKRKN